MRGDVCLKTLLKAIPFLLLYVLPQITFSSEIQGRVVGVCDGDTITVLNNGHAEALRLNGIDCPEKGQDFGARAKQLTSDLCFGKSRDCRDAG
jgi:micrococcal nuclease